MLLLNLSFPRRLTHSVEVMENNFPHILKVNFQGQAMEIARQCVQPPLRRKPQYARLFHFYSLMIFMQNLAKVAWRI